MAGIGRKVLNGSLASTSAGVLSHALSRVAMAADPTTAPSATTAPGSVSEALIQTNARLGELMVTVGLAMLILVFIALAVAAVVKFARKKPPVVAAGVGDLLGQFLKALPDLVRTPGGIGGLILLLGVILLLGTAATQSGQLDAFGGGGSGDAMVTPSPAPGTAPPAVPPTDAGTPRPS